MRYRGFYCIVLLVVAALAALPAEAGRYKRAKEAYGEGRFEEAASILVKQVRSHPKDMKSAELLTVVLPLAYEQREEAIEEAKFDGYWDLLVREYRALADLSHGVKTLPRIIHKKTKTPFEFPTVDVADELRDAIDRAAEHHYLRGLDLSKRFRGREAADAFDAAMEHIPNYRDARILAADALYQEGLRLRDSGEFKNAAIRFRLLRKYDGDYKDALALYEECRVAAIQRICVLPFENLSGKEHLGAMGDILSDQVLAKVMSRDPEFLEFVNRDQMRILLAERGEVEFGTVDAGSAMAASKLAGVDAFLFGKILIVDEQFPQDEVSDSETATAQARNSTTGQDEAITVKFQERTRWGYVDVRATYSVIDGHSGKVLDGNELRERREDLARWITYTGDERALPGWAIQRETPGGERPLRTKQDLALEAIDAISSSVAAALLATFD